MMSINKAKYNPKPIPYSSGSKTSKPKNATKCYRGHSNLQLKRAARAQMKLIEKGNISDEDIIAMAHAIQLN